MVDAARLSKKGVPVVVTAHNTFETAAKMHAKVHGTPSIPIVVIQVPETSESKEQLKSRLDAVWEHIATSLVN